MNNFVIADPDKCIGCRTCEVACVMAHGEHPLEQLTEENFLPRLRLVRTAKISMPIQCRQCEDAPCAQSCPEQAILQNGHSVQVTAGKCIGCKSCLLACPYGAIDLVVRPSSTGAKLNTVEALKCDLCLERTGGPACIQVCPTKALYQVEGSQMAGRLQQKRRKAAMGVVKVSGN